MSEISYIYVPPTGTKGGGRGRPRACLVGWCQSRDRVGVSDSQTMGDPHSPTPNQPTLTTCTALARLRSHHSIGTSTALPHDVEQQCFTYSHSL